MVAVPQLEGKVVIITGATLGIGAAISRRVVAEGASVVLVARGRDRGEALVSELGAKSRFVGGSVADVETADLAVAAAAELGGVDVLVNNAGSDFTGDLLDTTEADAKAVFETNAFGAMWMLVRVARELRERGGGSIVNVTSRVASVGVPTMAVYAASKGALDSLSRTAAVELAGAGIRVNAVAPGITDTPLIREWIGGQPDPAAFERSLAASVPLGRIGTPDDVAAAVIFLASDAAAYITGVSIAVDGGYTAA